MSYCSGLFKKERNITAQKSGSDIISRMARHFDEDRDLADIRVMDGLYILLSLRAYLYVPEPDALAEEFSSRNVGFFLPLQDNEDGLRGFEIKDADGYLLYFGRPNSK
jgi:hypothetical protein